MISLAITGGAGRMGRRLIALARESPDLQVVAAIERADHPQLSRDAGELAGVGTLGLPLSDDLRDTPDVLIDFSSPSAFRHWLKTCRDRKIAMLVGTTGLTDADLAAIDSAADDIPILHATNMSLGIAVLTKIAAEVARLLGPDYDIELVEAHHRFKKDAPSGTALSILDAILESSGKMRDALVFGREGADATRQPGNIGVHALRMGDEVGRHTVYFGGLGERLELTHRATNRDVFVHGALRAARWLAGRKPGRYRIGDVLGI
jgi:4-hydroxy-tetrahydrodipicolinate reductase